MPKRHCGTATQIAFNGAEIAGNDQDRGQHNKAEENEHATQQEGVTPCKEGEVDKRVGHPQSADQRYQQKEEARDEEGDDCSGVQPVESLPLIEGYVK
jgi:hypothetical protein